MYQLPLKDNYMNVIPSWHNGYRTNIFTQLNTKIKNSLHTTFSECTYLQSPDTWIMFTYHSHLIQKITDFLRAQILRLLTAKTTQIITRQISQ